MVRYATLFVALTLAFSPIMSSASHARNIGVSAIVNNDLITSSDVDARYNLAVQGANLTPSAQEQKIIRKQALDALIDEQIRLQEIRRQNVMPTDAEINEGFARLASQNNMSPDQFKAVLNKSSGMYQSLRNQIQTQLGWNNVIRKKIRPQVTISDEDVNAYLSNKEKNQAKVEYQVAEIFLRNSESNKELAETLVKDLRSGKQRFSALARQFSQGLEASKGGLLGWIEEKRLEPVLDTAIAQTPVGKISDVVTSQRGLHIFLVREKRDILSTDLASQRIHIKQIMLRLPPNLPPDVQKQAQDHMKFLRSEAKNCKAMDDVITKVASPLARDLGQVRLADVPAALIKVVKDLPIDQISETQQLPDGYGIYMVCGREENSETTVRDDVADSIGTDRLNRLQNRYYRDLRASSFVDIKEN